MSHLRGRPSKDLGSPRVCQHHHAERNRRCEDGNHPKLGGVGMNGIEAGDCADQQDRRHQDADDANGDGDGAFLESAYPRPTIASKFVLSGVIVM